MKYIHFSREKYESHLLSLFISMQSRINYFRYFIKNDGCVEGALWVREVSVGRWRTHLC